VAAGSACDHGLVASIGKKAPGCLEACPQTCGPLAKAITAYMSGGKKAAKGAVCANPGAFACAFDHGSCAPLIAQAKGAGAPGSKGSLFSQCDLAHVFVATAEQPEAAAPAAAVEAPPAQESQALVGEALSASVAAGSACDHGLVASIGKKAPGCLEACPQTCGPLAKAITAYMSGGKKAAKGAVCANPGAFACAFDHGSCAPLIAQAKGAGAPGSKGSLYSQCQ